MKTLVIGEFIEPPFSEGSVNVVLNWVKASHLAGVDISVMSLSSKFSGHRQMFGIDFEYIKTDRPRFQTDLAVSLRFQTALLKNLDFDVIHFGSSIDGLSAIPVLSMLKLQSNKMVASYLTKDWCSRYTPLFSNFFFQMITVPSKRMFEVFAKKQVLGSKMQILPSCIDENWFCPRDKAQIRSEVGLPQSSFIVFTVGHFRRGRLLFLLIRLINEMIGEGANIQLLIGWTGQGEKDCIDEIFSIAKKNMAIKIVPPTEKINLYYNACDVYVLSAGSDYVIETPLSLLEAASSGVPAIAFDVNASSEIIKNGASGYIIKENNFAEVKQRINQLMKDTALLKNMSTDARKLALNSFSYQKLGPQLYSLYRKIVDA